MTLSSSINLHQGKILSLLSSRKIARVRTMKMSLKNPMKNNLRRILKLDHNLKYLKMFAVTQSSHLERNHSSKSISLEKYGTSLRIFQTNMTSLLNKQSFLDVKILTLASEFTQVVMIHTEHLLVCLIWLLKIIMDINKVLNIRVIWILLNCNALHLVIKKLN